MDILVSVIIPIYNVEQFLHQCIDSVLNQTYSNLQVILVDDSSPDSCPKICDEYKALDSRVEVIHKENGGLGLARNSGLELAKGKYVIFIDSDDWIDRNYIENQVIALEEHNADVLVHGFSTCDFDGLNIKKSFLLKIGVFNNVVEDVLLPTIAPKDKCPNDEVLPIGTPFKMYRLDIIKDNALVFNNEKICVAEDIFFNIDYMIKCKSAVIIEEYGYNYRTNLKSISHKYNKNRVEATFEFYKRLKAAIDSSEELMYGIEHRVERSYLGKVRTALRLIEGSGLKFKEKISEIKKLLDHPYTCKALSEYPIENYRGYLKFISLLMKKQKYVLVLFAFAVRRVLRNEK